MNTVKKILTPKVRRWLYGIAIAAVPVLVYFKLLEPEATPIVIPLIVAIFNVNQDPEAPEAPPQMEDFQ